jgi:hypothetical protein
MKGRLKRRWEDDIKMDLKETGRMWIAFIWLLTGAIDGLL